MVVNKAQYMFLVKLEVNNYLIEQINQFKYLGSAISSDGKCSIKIRQIIAVTKRQFKQER